MIDRSDGDHLWQGEFAEAFFDRGTSGFRRITLPPMLERQSPGDLDAGHEAALEIRSRQTNQADDLRLAADHVAAIAVITEMSQLPLEPRGALLRRQRAAQ